MQCANPACRVESLYFRSGSLHAVDRLNHGGTPAGGREQYLIWLCAKCSPCFVVDIWRPPGEQIQRRVINSQGSRYDLAA